MNVYVQCNFITVLFYGNLYWPYRFVWVGCKLGRVQLTKTGVSVFSRDRQFKVVGAQWPRSQARTRTHAELFLNSYSSAAFSERLCLHSTMRRCASGHHVCIPHTANVKGKGQWSKGFLLRRHCHLFQKGCLPQGLLPASQDHKGVSWLPQQQGQREDGACMPAE